MDFNNKNVFVRSVAQNRLSVKLNNQQKDKGSEQGTSYMIRVIKEGVSDLLNVVDRFSYLLAT